ncbi:unnamed protein product [Mytilus coruscus]|uniref:B box-type domain-containing protein n=1 Tax=Mytilus coruscus TaxID=42192 RepID=A0A6J8DMZ6_MYTCO|nr:unnamed protein product [Mytilus coruscus]
MTTNFNYYYLLACVFNFATCSLLETTCIEAPECGPCQSQNIFKAANKWCTTCEEGLCDNCNVHHKANKSITTSQHCNKTRLKKQSENRRYTVNELRTKINGYLDSLESQLLEKSQNMLTVEETTCIEAPECGPCQSQDIFKAANKWCTTCEEGLCDNCNVHHKANKASRHHNTVQIEKYKELQPFLSTLKTKCDLHDKPLELYFPNHENPCCSCCASINHATCLGITSFNQITTAVKKSCLREDIDKKMDDLLNKFDIIIKNRSGNKTRLKKQSENRRYTVNELRTKINGYLDSLESQLFEKSENMLTVEDAIESNLEFMIDPMIADSLSKLVDVHLKREKSTPSLNLQMTPSTCQIICDETAVLLTNFHTSAFTKDTTISSIMATLSGEIIVSDFSNKLLVLFCKEGKISKTIQLKEVPFGLTGIRDDKFVLSLPFLKTIRIYRMEDYEVD